MTFFKQKHSSAATAHLQSLDEGSASSSYQHTKDQVRRLASEQEVFDDDVDNMNDDKSSNPTKSITFSDTTSEDSDDDDDDSDAEYDVRLTDALSITSNDDEDALSACTSTGGGDGNSISDLICDINNEYDDGDLQTLNALVNKLHAVELKRERAAQQLHNNDTPGDDHQQTIPNSINNSSTTSTIDIPSVLPKEPPPHFSPLQTKHRLSISKIDSWCNGESLEIVPTDSVEQVMPTIQDEWKSEQLSWKEEHRKSLSLNTQENNIQRKSSDSKELLELKRSRTQNDTTDQQLSSPVGLYTRHHSLPSGLGAPQLNKSPNKHRTLSVSSSTHRHYKYGKPPTLPNSKNPNPMVSSSSKKIHKKHARYALTAGMMLGIRESVGGALGVEAELQISNWEGWERAWQEEEDNQGIAVECDNENAKKENDTHTVGGGGEKELQHEESPAEETTGDTKENNTTASQSQSLESDINADSTQSSSEVTNHTQQSHTNNNNRTTNEVQEAYTTLTTECERVTKYKFPPNQFYLGSNTSKPLPHKYKFKVYAPLVFARIRSLFGVEKQTFLHSICGKFNFYEFASNARSGQFFFYSHDGRYMIKTLTYTESKFLREILPHYYRHLTRYPSTFLTHFYGMYRVHMPATNQRLHFIIMRSVFHTEKKIDRVWDLKGSKTGRKANVGDSVGKDLDILEEGRKLRFVKPKARGAFLEQLARDATFLARLGIMDYSLLLGLHDCEGNGEKQHTVGAGNSGEEDAPSTPGAPRNEDQRKAASAQEEPFRSNTPFRRGIIKRASSAGDTKVGNDFNDGFKVLDELGSTTEAPLAATSSSDTTTTPTKPDVAIRSSSLNTIPESPIPPPIRREPSIPANGITSREDSGIEGYRVKLEDGTLAKKELYFCGVIDILQYYNVRKVGETVMRKAVGNSGEDISCVDPETYGKRFVKFISNLVESDEED